MIVLTRVWQIEKSAAVKIGHIFIYAAHSSSIGSFMSSTFFHGDLVMKKISTAILPLRLIQEEQLSVTGERMCTKYW